MDLECPYCEAGSEVNHDDGFGYEEDVRHEMSCRNCDKNFIFTTSILYCYEAEKADCLNGANHEYKLTHTCPNEFSKMRCSMCDDERELTDKERTDFKIGTKKSYFEKINKIKK